MVEKLISPAEYNFSPLMKHPDYTPEQTYWRLYFAVKFEYFHPFTAALTLLFLSIRVIIQVWCYEFLYTDNNYRFG